MAPQAACTVGLLVDTDIMRGAAHGRLPVAGRYQTCRKLSQDYRLGRTLGYGANGPVKLAKSRADGRSYAVKSFQKDELSQEKLVLLKSEVEIFLSLDHPHVARLEVVLETDEMLHLVMEYLAGGELRSRIKERKRFLEKDAAEASRQMLLAIAYLHAKQIAHRDLKLENWMYEAFDTDHLKLIDFGLAACWDGEAGAKLTRACGSVHYVAPEVLRHAYTEKADMWSLGVIVYMLLVGSPLFYGKTESEVISKVRAGRLNFSPRFREQSTLARDFVQQLLVVDPANRMSTEEALRHPWIQKCSKSQELKLEPSTLGSLRAFARASRLRRAVLGVMAWSVTTEDRHGLREQFLAMDKEHKGAVTRAQLKVALQSFQVDDCEADTIFESLDTDEDGKIGYSEFLAAALNANRGLVREDLLLRTFSRFDRAGRGRLSPGDLRAFLGEEEAVCAASEGGAGAIGVAVEALLQEVGAGEDISWNYDKFFLFFHSEQLTANGVDIETTSSTSSNALNKFGYIATAGALIQHAATTESKFVLPSIAAMFRRMASQCSTESLQSQLSRSLSEDFSGATSLGDEEGQCEGEPEFMTPEQRRQSFQANKARTMPPMAALSRFVICGT